ncbi:hypothetical protein B0H13DRAFT_2277992 [Mycena leptocephala]|nr:hypothetical protein B0H13DRAFT_2277992 [Mycena leptocephala]
MLAGKSVHIILASASYLGFFGRPLFDAGGNSLQCHSPPTTTTNANIIHAARTKGGEQGEEESRDRRLAKQEVRDDNRAVGMHSARIPVRFTSARSANGLMQQPRGLAGACGGDLYDSDTYFPRTTGRARLGGIGLEVVEVGSGSDKWWVLASPERTSMASLKDTLLLSRALDGNGLDEAPNIRPSFPFFGCIGVLMHRLGCAAARRVHISYYSCTVKLCGDRCGYLCALVEDRNACLSLAAEGRCMRAERGRGPAERVEQGRARADVDLSAWSRSMCRDGRCAAWKGTRTRRCSRVNVCAYDGAGVVALRSQLIISAHRGDCAGSTEAYTFQTRLGGGLSRRLRVGREDTSVWRFQQVQAVQSTHVRVDVCAEGASKRVCLVLHLSAEIQEQWRSATWGEMQINATLVWVAMGTLGCDVEGEGVDNLGEVLSRLLQIWSVFDHMVKRHGLGVYAYTRCLLGLR